MMRKPRMRGFTLLEVLAALVLLSLLMLAVWSGIRTVQRSLRDGQAFVARTDALRAAQDFLRRELAQATPQAWTVDDRQTPVVFRGSASEVQFVSPLPGYLGRLGPQLQRVRLVPDGTGGGYRLEVAFAQLPVDGSPPKALGTPQVLLRGIREGHFSYDGLDARRQPTGWSETWTLTDHLPAVVRLQLRMRHGDWPQLVMPIRVDAVAVPGGAMAARHLMRPLGAGQ